MGCFRGVFYMFGFSLDVTITVFVFLYCFAIGCYVLLYCFGDERYVVNCLLLTCERWFVRVFHVILYLELSYYVLYW